MALSTADAFLWGGAGGGITAAAVFVLPGYGHAVRIQKSWIKAIGGRQGILEALGLVIVYAVIGGVVTLIPASVTRGQAILIGLGVQTTLKSVLAGGKEIFREPEVPAAPAVGTGGA